MLLVLLLLFINIIIIIIIIVIVIIIIIPQHLDMVQVIEILPHGRRGGTFILHSQQHGYLWLWWCRNTW